MIGPSVLSAANQNASSHDPVGQLTPIWLYGCALQNSSN